MPQSLEMKRQGALHSVPLFRECCICNRDDHFGEWIPVTCHCSFDEVSYAHSSCLKYRNQCKACYDTYESQQPPVKNTEIIEKATPYKWKTTLVSTVLIGFSLLNDIISCISVDKVDRQELQNMTQADYLWLPRFHTKRFQPLKTFFFIKLYLFFFLILLLIVIRKLKN